MKISIITATRNAGKVIGPTIESIMLQTHCDIELIIVDATSADGTLPQIQEWHERHPHKIRYISEPDNGVYSALNKGIDMASGDVIGTLHAGDRFTSHEILAQVAATMQKNDVDMIYGDIHYVNPQSKEITRIYSGKGFSPDMLRYGIAPPHPSLYTRAEVFKRYGKYKEDYLIGADFEMFVRLMLINNARSMYLPLDMVEMANGGLSTRLWHRLTTNNREKLRALRENSVPTSHIMLLKRYLYILKIIKNL